MRNIYQHARARETLNVRLPQVVGMYLRKLYQAFRQPAEDKLHVKLPVVLSLAIKNLLRRYTSTPVRFTVHLPEVVSIYLRSYLQKLFWYPLDETFTVHLPEVVDLHHKNIVNKYIEEEAGKLNMGLPFELETYLKNVLRTHDQDGEILYITLPADLELGGTTKPYIRSPVLSGSVELGTLFNVDLNWVDTSVTHTGYLLYRDVSPIPPDTTMEPFLELGRFEDSIEDWDVDEDTTYYYRITPKSMYGRFFSNLLSLYVPLYLRAPHSFETAFQSLSPTMEGVGVAYTLTAIGDVGVTFTSLGGILEVSGMYAYQTYMSDVDHRLVKVESPLDIAGTSKIESILRGEKARYVSIEYPENIHTSFFNEVFIGDIDYHLNKVIEPASIDASFLGLTKNFIRSTFVVLGSAVENRLGTFEALTAIYSVQYTGSREMVLTGGNAEIIVEAELSNVSGYHNNEIEVRSGSYFYKPINGVQGEAFTDYQNPTMVIDPEYSYVPVNSAYGSGEYTPEMSTYDISYGYFNTGTSNIQADPYSFGSARSQNVYCVLGSDATDLECHLIKETELEGVSTEVSTLDQPRNIQTSTEEDQEFTLFSGYFPPVGYPLTYDTYVIGSSVIPVFGTQIIAGDQTRFTIYERMFESREVKSGYTPPEGTSIHFSLFVDEE